MKYVYTLLCFVLLISCNDTEFSLSGNGAISTITFNVTSTSANKSAKIRTVFIESGFFKFDNTVDTGLPYNKAYSAVINFAASLGFDYEDKTTGTFNNYTITVEILRNNILVEKRDFLIDVSGKKVNLDVMINK
ncbi:hypothetical protein ACQY1Q_09140 [Tenacibaculum sp. TC6]|uniref:hypothetical protein n=1 Tax=Tenacibaculum sp. TC6 TaxID=3423223 RepID=UPI003D364A99